jgi:hypothetical protein
MLLPLLKRCRSKDARGKEPTNPGQQCMLSWPHLCNISVDYLLLKKMSIFGLFCNTEAALKVFLVKSLKKAFNNVSGSKYFLYDQFLDYSLGSTKVSALLMKTVFNKVICFFSYIYLFVL